MRRSVGQCQCGSAIIYSETGTRVVCAGRQCARRRPALLTRSCSVHHAMQMQVTEERLQVCGCGAERGMRLVLVCLRASRVGRPHICHEPLIQSAMVEGGNNPGRRIRILPHGTGYSRRIRTLQYRVLRTWYVVCDGYSSDALRDSLSLDSGTGRQLHPYTYEHGTNYSTYIRIYTYTHARARVARIRIWTILLPRDRPAPSPAAPGSSHLTD